MTEGGGAAKSGTEKRTAMPYLTNPTPMFEPSFVFDVND
jgi:hypothetical protein